jgi:hypothetical protein
MVWSSRYLHSAVEGGCRPKGTSHERQEGQYYGFTIALIDSRASIACQPSVICSNPTVRSKINLAWATSKSKKDKPSAVILELDNSAFGA